MRHALPRVIKPGYNPPSPEGHIMTSNSSSLPTASDPTPSDDFAALLGMAPVSTKTVEIPAAMAKGFAASLGYFSANKSNVLSGTRETSAEADLFKAQIRQWASSRDLNASFPKFVDGHMTKDVVDPDTGKVTNPAHWVDANKYPAHWNTGLNVTFRFSAKRDKGDAGVDTSTVTVSSK